jgi:hypothetical protein
LLFGRNSVDCIYPDGDVPGRQSEAAQASTWILSYVPKVTADENSMLRIVSAVA